MENFTIATPEIESWLNFSLETYDLDFFRHLYLPKKFAWKKIKKEYPVFRLFLKISNIDLGPMKSKFFKSEKSTKSAIKKSTYSENFKNFAQKLWFWRTNCYLFFGTPCTHLTIIHGFALPVGPKMLPHRLRETGH